MTGKRETLEPRPEVCLLQAIMAAVFHTPAHHLLRRLSRRNDIDYILLKIV
jgi:hypothetical protein